MDRRMTHRFMGAGFLSLLVAAGACRSPANPGPVPASAPLVRLVDSVAIDEGDGGTLRRVEVRHGTRVDTLADVLTFDLPLLVGGSRLLGFHYGGDVAGAFEYDLATRTVKRDSLPGDFHPFFSAPAFSPDGRHLAYVVVPGDETGYAVARTWPGLDLVWRSAVVRIPATDAAGGNQVRWLSPDTAEAVIETGYSTDTAWYRVVGSVRQRAVVSADTLREPPRW
jgi:hypothetical protein